MPEGLSEGDNEDDVEGLSAAAVAGDLAAFRLLFDRYYPRVYRYALTATQGNDSRAHEIAQETLLRFHRHLQVFTSNTRLWFWLSRVARSVLIDAIRVQERQRKLEESLKSVEADEAPTDILLIQALNRCCADLSPADRNVVESFYFHRQSISDIAAALGTSYKATESKLGRIRARLRQDLMNRLNHE